MWRLLPQWDHKFGYWLLVKNEGQQSPHLGPVQASVATLTPLSDSLVIFSMAHYAHPPGALEASFSSVSVPRFFLWPCPLWLYLAEASWPSPCPRARLSGPAAKTIFTVFAAWGLDVDSPLQLFLESR